MFHPVLNAPRTRGRLLVVFGALGALFLAHGASAQSLNCGQIDPHALVLASDPGQAPAQSEDATEHALPWSADMGQQAGGSNAHKRIDATCTGNGGSMTIRIEGAEWGSVVTRPGEKQSPAAMAGWAPVWTTHVTVPAHRQLEIAVASTVNYLTCQLVAPGVAMNWTLPYRDDERTVAGVRDFDVVLNCASSGLHAISPMVANDWVNGESVVLNLTTVGPAD